MQTQTKKMEIIEEIVLDDLELQRNKEIDLYYQGIFNDCNNNFFKISNIEGKIVIFADTNNVSVEKWKGHREYIKRAREIEEEQDELMEKSEKEYKRMLSKLKE